MNNIYMSNVVMSLYNFIVVVVVVLGVEGEVHPCTAPPREGHGIPVTDDQCNYEPIGTISVCNIHLTVHPMNEDKQLVCLFIHALNEACMGRNN